MTFSPIAMPPRRPADAATLLPSHALAYPSELGAHQLVERQVARTPDAVAAVFGAQTLSYAELNARANQLARHLIEAGVERGGAVALLLARTPDCLVALLAVLKAGAAYVPIDAGLPPQRIAYMLSDSAVGHVLVDDSCPAQAQPALAPLQRIDVRDARIYRGDGANLDLAVAPQQEAYCIYTSGSTGVPKGVMVPHSGLVNYIWWAKSHYLTPDIGAVALYSSLSFDLTITSIFVPLIAGLTVHVYADGGDDVPALYRVIEDNRVDLLKLTPSHLALLNTLPLAGSRLKTLIVGGEDLRTEVALATHKRLHGNVRIYNEYGPTETVVGCMIYRYDPASDLQGSVPIGGPIANTDIVLLDEQRRPVKQGESGEIHIGGAGLALGYRNQDEMTARHFIAHPGEPGARLYASGDLGQINSQGRLHFLGRKDFQIKLRGYRIEPGELESVLLAYPGIAECSVDTTHAGRGRREAAPTQFCSQCGIASTYPNTSFDADLRCNHCAAFNQYKEVIDSYFGDMEQLQAIIDGLRARAHPRYDCIVALSGGKDSTYALCKVIDMGARVLAFTLDNGYISEQAKANIDRVVARLGIDHRYLSTAHMNAIFTDSLKRHSNVCNGCFKTIYTMAIQLAQEVGVDDIVMGLSKGQLFETRLTELFREKTFDPVKFERNLIDARKIYHRIDDAVARLLDTSCVTRDGVIEQVRFIDFYRYCNVQRHDMYAYIEQRVGWSRPSDTGRSTNCLINDVGIYVHNHERRYHNYSLPYSWDVRVGHISREDAMRELDDSTDIDEARVNAIMQDIGYTLDAGNEENQLVAYYVAPSEIAPSALRDYVGRSVPAYMQPAYYVQLDKMPLTPNGKVNRQALPKPTPEQSSAVSQAVAPRNEIEAQIAAIWTGVLQIERAGVHDNFFAMGGNSLPALMLLYKLDAQFGKTVSIEAFSAQPTISALAEQLQAAAPAA
ncbi:amino acid adenylation domain-containing protein [Rugamonas sp. CCM 8940]|uniref:amino acid adenylation domain-containing protein n=1 Tax=Rugamonas sp. CCM 8940 TaxID=2765359 RepID=UPI0018F36B18|nr:amino acid adenylation domain-containing protein [Rugamonas sp. CCM 8940]MBJ7312891.1 amino acid adenylation domain-containing protein [Rugamonas sp. CCM 8940]